MWGCSIGVGIRVAFGVVVCSVLMYLSSIRGHGNLYRCAIIKSADLYTLFFSRKRLINMVNSSRGG